MQFPPEAYILNLNILSEIFVYNPPPMSFLSNETSDFTPMNM